ncbi:hypothetical protein D3C80_1193840 [compost metagenome]
MQPSTRPQARLQPTLAISSSRTEPSPALATLKVPVKVSTMSRPNRISDMRDTGSSTSCSGDSLPSCSLLAIAALPCQIAVTFISSMRRKPPAASDWRQISWRPRHVAPATALSVLLRA